MPMDIDFAIQDAFSMVRPEWKILKTLEEAGAAFADACKDNYKHETSEKPDATDVDIDAEDGELDDDIDGRRTPYAGEDGSSSEEVEVSITHLSSQHQAAHGLQEPELEEPSNNLDSDDQSSGEEDEHIIVTRPENERDPEADADFDRELAKMMAESVNETRKSDRKGQLDVALPMRKPQREVLPNGVDDGVLDSERQPPNIMQFSLLSKRGNRSQVISLLLNFLSSSQLMRFTDAQHRSAC